MPSNAVEVPSVTGPVTGGVRGRPFNSYVGDLDRLGYVEEEYFLEGDAVAYRPIGELTADGKWNVAPTGTHPYKTRLLVRRPRDAARFNGSVIVEWLNVTSGHDLSVVFDAQLEGFAFVGVSAQCVSVDGFSKNSVGLKTWDPGRYGSLSIPRESLGYDIFTQAARAVGPDRGKRGVDPLAGLPVRKLIATGASQSSCKVLTYLNAIQPQTGVFDGFLLTVGGATPALFGDDVFDPANMPIDQAMRPFGAPVRIRDDLATPTMLVNSETETLAYYPVRRPDDDWFRYWEVAGASHGPTPLQAKLAPMQERDGIPDSSLTRSVGATSIPRSEVDWTPAADAALVRLHEWISSGVAPPSQPRIEVKPSSPPAIVRDGFGIAVGGVRMPDVEVPIARNSGVANVPELLAGLGGVTEPFTPEQIRRLYPTHAGYVARVTQATQSAVRAGVLLPAHTLEYVVRAQALAW
jgi:hypothetical protein